MNKRMPIESNLISFLVTYTKDTPAIHNTIVVQAISEPGAWYLAYQNFINEYPEHFPEDFRITVQWIDNPIRYFA